MLFGEPNRSTNIVLAFGWWFSNRSYYAISLCQAMCILYILPDYFSKLVMQVTGTVYITTEGKKHRELTCPRSQSQ